MDLSEIFFQSYQNYGRYFLKTIQNPFYNGFSPFYSLIILSLFVWTLEIALPWRKNQAVIRKDFWLDSFYMFFNFFFFNLIIFAALSNTTSNLFESLMTTIGLPKAPVVSFFSDLAIGWQFLIFFLIYDFTQWLVHNALHRIPFLWRFHRVHHSVREMGFAAHLRYHFMENVIYKIALYVMLSYLLKFKLENAFILYTATTLIGHLNHANLGWDYGPFKYLINNPKMHIWHHAKALPENHKKGANFALTLSVWDYLFKTAYTPYDGRDIELGFEDVEEFPEGFMAQQAEAFRRREG
jgi:sterol desaturase/sphingolipid hydroxylase (fatty acid hydroxylase superfamily)